MSANLCDALRTMTPSGDQSRLEISVSWARMQVEPAKVKVDLGAEDFRRACDYAT